MRIEADDPSKKQPKKEEFNPVKSEKRSFKSEIAKMKSMGFKDGWEYFWSYYKVPVFVIIGVIAIVISITMSVIRNSRPFIVQVHVYNNYLSDNADVDSLEKEFAAYEDMSLKDYQISFNLTEYLDFSGSDEASYTSTPGCKFSREIKKTAPQKTKGFCRRKAAAKWFGAVAGRLFSILKWPGWVREYHERWYSVKQVTCNLTETTKCNLFYC